MKVSSHMMKHFRSRFLEGNEVWVVPTHGRLPSKGKAFSVHLQDVEKSFVNYHQANVGRWQKTGGANGEKSLRFRKCPDTCGRGLSVRCYQSDQSVIEFRAV